ncbi:MAG: hypothetical protein GX895_09955 [Clostridiales bacterium]|nr:hypothetical protein [Clostridiales bacterium]
MNIKAISNLDILKIYDNSDNKTYYGCDQEWYSSKWQRLSGCGPTVATNIIFYLLHRKDVFSYENSFNGKTHWMSLMEEIWQYVTPTSRGIPNTKLFCEGMVKYSEAKEMNILHSYFDVPKDKNYRRPFQELIKFIETGLDKDIPVAFLNLCNGNEKNLDKWHWVTIVSLEYEEDGSSAFANILDCGSILKVDLALWYDSTKEGGGFVFVEAGV